MVFWIAILVGVLFVWLAVRMGFYETWVLFFNIVVSMYLAIFLAPLVKELAPTPGGAASYGTALSLVLLAGGCFAVLQGLSYVFLTGQFNIPFPRLFDILLSGGLGFGAGFLTLSFLALVLATTPLAQNSIIAGIGMGVDSQRANISSIVWCCDRLHALAGPGDRATQAAVQRLLESRAGQPDEGIGAERPGNANESVLPPRPDGQPGEPATTITPRPERRTISPDPNFVE